MTAPRIWGEGDAPNSGRRYKFLLPAVPPGPPLPARTCDTASTTSGNDIPAHSAGEVQLAAHGGVADCERACCAQAECDGFVRALGPRVCNRCAGVSGKRP